MQPLSFDEIPELLSRLVDKSLVQVDASGRYHLLQLVRQFAQEEMARTDEGGATRTGHLHFYADLCETNAPEIAGQKFVEAHEFFMAESENIRQGVEWAITNPATWANAVQVLTNTFWSQYTLGRATDGVLLCPLVIENAPPNADPKAYASIWSLLATYQQLSDHPDASASCDRAIELGENAGSDWAIARATFQKGMYALRKGKLEEVQPLLTRALTHIRKVPGVCQDRRSSPSSPFSETAR